MTSSSGATTSAAEESARLLEALRLWWQSHDTGQVPIATGSAECQVCPICRAIAVLRDHQPEMVDHITNAAESLLAAFRSIVVAHEDEWVHPNRGDVERIDVE